MRRVVITRSGIWSCLRTDLETGRESLYKGKSGIVEKKDTMLCWSGAIFQSTNSTVTTNHGAIFPLKGIKLSVSKTALYTCREILGEGTLNQILQR